MNEFSSPTRAVSYTKPENTNVRGSGNQKESNATPNIEDDPSRPTSAPPKLSHVYHGGLFIFSNNDPFQSFIQKNEYKEDGKYSNFFNIEEEKGEHLAEKATRENPTGLSHEKNHSKPKLTVDTRNEAEKDHVVPRKVSNASIDGDGDDDINKLLLSRQDSSFKGGSINSPDRIEATPKNNFDIIEMIEQKLNIDDLKALANVGFPNDPKANYPANSEPGSIDILNHPNGKEQTEFKPPEINDGGYNYPNMMYNSPQYMGGNYYYPPANTSPYYPGMYPQDQPLMSPDKLYPRQDGYYRNYNNGYHQNYQNYQNYNNQNNQNNQNNTGGNNSQNNTAGNNNNNNNNNNKTNKNKQHNHNNHGHNNYHTNTHGGNNHGNNHPNNHHKKKNDENKREVKKKKKESGS